MEDGARKRLADQIRIRLGGPGRHFDRHCTTLARVAGTADAGSIKDWLALGGCVAEHSEFRLADWVAAGMPLPDHSATRTDKRLAVAPLRELSKAAAHVLGHGNRTTLMIAASAMTPSSEIASQARRAVAALHQVHKERLLDELNIVLLRAGQQPV